MAPTASAPSSSCSGTRDAVPMAVRAVEKCKASAQGLRLMPARAVGAPVSAGKKTVKACKFYRAFSICRSVFTVKIHLNQAQLPITQRLVKTLVVTVDADFSSIASRDENKIDDRQRESQGPPN